MYDLTDAYEKAGYIGHFNLSTCSYYNNSVLVRHCIAQKKLEAFFMSLLFWIPIFLIVVLAITLGLAFIPPYCLRFSSDISHRTVETTPTQHPRMVTFNNRRDED